MTDGLRKAVENEQVRFIEFAADMHQAGQLDKDDLSSWPQFLQERRGVIEAARRFLALTETGRQVRYCIEHQALIGALPYLCNVANWVIDGGGSPTDCRIVPRLLADYLTEEE